MSSAHLDPKVLIYTDVDGCLLDHYSYSFEPAKKLLKELHELNIPVIPASSKTEAELLYLRSQWNNEHPFIIENGAAVFIPNRYFPKAPSESELVGDLWIKRFTCPRQHWLKLIKRTQSDQTKIKTFADATTADIASLTGLAEDAASRASRRQFGEPIAWQGTEQGRERFISELRQSGATVTQGGRFLHVSGDCDKGKAMRWLTAIYKTAFGQPVTTIAIGDSQNDIGMLESADIAVLIPSPTHDLPRLRKPKHMYTASQQGPHGWTESVSMILRILNVK
ncbi:MAG: HAD-IIB family hydrolase [Gammaproteobacteria bacterium]